MILHNKQLFSIYFGDAKDQLFSKDYLALKTNSRDLLSLEPFSALSKSMGISSLAFLHQVHGLNGTIINQSNRTNFVPFGIEGDFLITNQSSTGLGVMTGDCLPIIFHDARTNAVGIAHAGWQGTVKGVAVETIKAMQQEFGTELTDIKVFFGPSAKKCCYEVSDDFIKNIEHTSFADEVLMRRADKLFFDVPEYNKRLMQEYGIAKDAFHMDYNICTMCNHEFCSHRRQAQSAGRQMTVVALK